MGNPKAWISFGKVAILRCQGVLKQNELRLLGLRLGPLDCVPYGEPKGMYFHKKSTDFEVPRRAGEK